MKLLICAVFVISRIDAAADACAMIPAAQINAMLGATKNAGLNTLKLPPKAAEGKACSYKGKDNSATYVWYRFATPAAAKEYLKMMRDSFEKQSIKTTSEKFDGEDGFSFVSGMLAVKKDVWLRVNVNSTAGKVLAPDLTRQLMLAALRVN